MIAELDKAGFDPRLVEPCGSGANGVLLLGEAPGEMEAETGIPFYPGAQAGSVLERAIRRIGATREQFVVSNVVPYRPPKNWLEGAPWEEEAINATQPLLQATLDRYKPRAILALGGTAIRATTGLAGDKLGVSHLVGYTLPSRYGIPVVATYHPSFLRRGATSRASSGEKSKRGGMSLFGVLLRCLRLAMEVSAGKRQPFAPPVDNPPPGYILYPTLEQATYYLYRENIRTMLAYDIETNYSTAEEDAEERPKEIRSIQFSWGAGQGIFVPWREPYLGVVRRALASENPKIGWNNWRFDDPVLRAAGMSIGGTIHDLMWAWHHSQPDLPRGLQFAAAMMGPAITQPSPKAWPFPWKHLDKESPEFYGIVDVDVLQHMVN